MRGGKVSNTTGFYVWMVCCACVFGSAGFLLANKSFQMDSQVASGEWKVQVQVPPCDNVRNLQVVFPHDLGGPITIECNNMPVGTK